jgi:hypothetical protein
MSAIKGLIIAAIGISISVALVPGMQTTLATITTPTYSAGIAGMAPIILLVFFAAIVFTVLRLVEV